MGTGIVEKSNDDEEEADIAIWEKDFAFYSIVKANQVEFVAEETGFFEDDLMDGSGDEVSDYEGENYDGFEDELEDSQDNDPNAISRQLEELEWGDEPE